MSRCHAHISYDDDDNDHRCREDALPGRRGCYLHDKYARGLSAPDYDDPVFAWGRVQPMTINRVRVGATTVWERGDRADR